MAIRWAQRGLIGLAVMILLAKGALTVVRPGGDFMLHWRFGQRLRTGTFLYERGMHATYPPAWAVPHVPLSLLAPSLAKPAFFLLGLAALGALGWVLNDLTRTAMPLREGQLFWVVTATLLATSRWIIRDYADGGQNLCLLTLSWLALWLFVKGRWGWGGASLGLAVALKCTPVIFVGYFLLKRQWKMAASALFWAGVFSLTPIFWLGPAGLVENYRVWTARVQEGMSQPDPSLGITGPEPLRNMSLRPSLARYLMHLPPGHPGRNYVDTLPEGDPGRRPDPWCVDFLNLSPATAGKFIRGVLLGGVLAVVWLCRKSLDKKEREPLLWEAALLSVLMALYSPYTWQQTCVATVPAFFLLCRGVAAGTLRARWLPRLLVGYMLLTLATTPGLLGKNLYQVVESYHPITFAFVGLVVILFVVRAQAAAPQPSPLQE